MRGAQVSGAFLITTLAICYSVMERNDGACGPDSGNLYTTK